MIAIIDAIGGTNLASICNALTRLGFKWTLTHDPQEVTRATHVILPGVGHAGSAMEQMRNTGLEAVIPQLKQPVLGICLGMQLLFQESEEGDTPTLGVIPGVVRRIRPEKSSYRIPHMGWNRLENLSPDNPLLNQVSDESFAYFVHSFRADQGPWVQAECWHGDRIPAVVSQRNFHGCQFHPEKSSSMGAQILRNFVAMKGE